MSSIVDVCLISVILYFNYMVWLGRWDSNPRNKRVKAVLLKALGYSLIFTISVLCTISVCDFSFDKGATHSPIN